MVEEYLRLVKPQPQLQGCYFGGFPGPAENKSRVTDKGCRGVVRLPASEACGGGLDFRDKFSR